MEGLRLEVVRIEPNGEVVCKVLSTPAFHKAHVRGCVLVPETMDQHDRRLRTGKYEE